MLLDCSGQTQDCQGLWRYWCSWKRRSIDRRESIIETSKLSGTQDRPGGPSECSIGRGLRPVANTTNWGKLAPTCEHSGDEERQAKAGLAMALLCPQCSMAPVSGRSRMWWRDVVEKRRARPRWRDS